MKYIDSFKEFLNNLTLEQLGALTHILVSVSVFLSLTSILGSIFGEFIIKKFTLETRWPRLAKWFAIRSQLQYTYIIFNSLFIFTLLGTVIYINLIILGLIKLSPFSYLID